MSGFDVPDFSGVTLPTSSSDTNRDDWDAAADAAAATWTTPEGIDVAPLAADCAAALGRIGR